MRDELMEKMKLSDINGKEKNYETVLRESRSAVQNYVRTGNKSKQLQLIMECEDKFQENYKKLLESTFREKNIWMEQGRIADLEKTIQKNICDGEMLKGLIETIYDFMQEYIHSILAEMAYYNNMNMIYEFLDNEMLKRKEEEKYEIALQKYSFLEKMIKFIEQNRRVLIKDVEKQLKISPKDLANALNHVYYFFIIDKKEAGLQISLSPQGMKFGQYIARKTPKWTVYEADQCVYHNCFEIMDKMENSLLQSRRLEIKIEAVSPSVERSIKSKYVSTFNHLCADRDEGYAFLLNKGVSYAAGKDDYDYGRKKEYRIIGKSGELYRTCT